MKIISFLIFQSQTPPRPCFLLSSLLFVATQRDQPTARGVLWEAEGRAAPPHGQLQTPGREGVWEPSLWRCVMRRQLVDLFLRSGGGKGFSFSFFFFGGNRKREVNFLRCGAAKDLHMHL